MKIRSVVLALLVTGCASIGQVPTSIRSPELLKNFKLGKQSEHDIVKLLGIPQLEVAADRDGLEYWSYYEDSKYQRLDLAFNQRTKRLNSVSWFVFDGDPEQNIENAKKLFPKAYFKTHDYQYLIADSMHFERQYVDNETGSVIDVDPIHDKVKALFRTKPGTIKTQDGFIGNFSEAPSQKWRVIADRLHRSTDSLRQAN